MKTFTSPLLGLVLTCVAGVLTADERALADTPTLADKPPVAQKAVARNPVALETGFLEPPPEARLRGYWWWLNGNVTKEAITRDLEEMAAKGFGGALICDAGGAEQDGNEPVPAGPTFFSPEWRELYRHALAEADRVGLELSLNIQSGWNLGGPMVKAEEAPKRLVWSETRVSGPGRVEQLLAKPQHNPALYQDVLVVAYPCKPDQPDKGPFSSVAARSEQSGHPALLAIDGLEDTFWVSSGSRPGEGPSRQKPEWLQFEFTQPLPIDGLILRGRKGYGPREGLVQVSDDGRKWQTISRFKAESGKELSLKFEQVSAANVRITFHAAFDPSHPDSPRNVQVCELRLLGAGQSWPPATMMPTIQNWQEKALHKVLGRSAPDTSRLLEELPSRPGEAELSAEQVVELTDKLAADGTLTWDVPAGEWQVLRFGYTLNAHCRVSTCSDGWKGYALDPFDADAFGRYWHAVVEPLIADAGPLAGRVLKYLHTDSWEVEVANWTPGLREEFRKRRGYDLLGYLPAITGRVVGSREVSNRFLHDFRKTMGDLAVDNHYRLFSSWAARHGLLLHPESGGPHAVPVDSLRCLGMNDAPMSEFWARSWRHRVADEDRFFVKQPASAAHTYGKRLVLAEGFTTIGPHWQETLWDNLKPSFDRALCEGLNRLVWHTFTCSPAEMGLPGQEYFAGTHFNPNSTWWSRSGPFLAYLNRCQFMLQQGLFVADAVYYYGDHVPNFAQLRKSDPAGVGSGYDYDVATEEVVLTRMSVKDGCIVLPDGMRYRVLVLPDRAAVSLPVLRKVKELVSAGATVIGPRPQASNSLQGYPECDGEIGQIADELWGQCDGKNVKQNRFGSGRVIWGKTARQVLLDDGVEPDFEFTLASTFDGAGEGPVLDYIHRRDGNTDIYFVCNRRGVEVKADVRFRVEGKAPELFDALTGQIRPLPRYSQAQGHTTVPLEFAPYGSWFVVFRKPASEPAPSTVQSNFPSFSKLAEIEGAWEVRFDPHWGGPAQASFPELVSWTKRAEDGIRFYSGTATYVKSFRFEQPPSADSSSRIHLDLGDVRQLAEVRLNGRELGVLWAKPFRVDVSDAIRPGENQLEIDVVNFWPNRVIGDAALPAEQRRTRTNIRKLTADTPLIESGMLGPVVLMRCEP